MPEGRMSSGLSRQWDAWDADLFSLRTALADDTEPPPPLKANDRWHQPLAARLHNTPEARSPAAASTTDQPSLPLPHSGQLYAMRPPLTPELIAQLDAATAEALDGKTLPPSEPSWRPGSGAPR